MRMRGALGVTLAIVLLAAGAGYVLQVRDGGNSAPAVAGGSHGRRSGRDPNRAIPVRVVEARRSGLDLWVDALGTVTAANTATVKSRVDGQLVRVAFQEGQWVRAGELLAQVDPRPFQVALDQAQGQLARDQAQLASARVELKRYRGLLKEDSIARQQVDTQAALVGQLEGSIQADRAQVANVRLQLDFTRITAPIGGRLGLRQVDTGNMVHPNDATGLVVITQTQPIFVVFAIPADGIAALLRRWHRGEPLEVQALDRDGTTLLARGTLASIDNRIDLATGTVKLKAEFANRDETLFPNQFVNARLKTATLSGATLVSAAAIQRGVPGTFVYLVKDDSSVTLHPVTLGPAAGDTVAVENGLQPGDRVVIDGADKLREGAKVERVEPGGLPGAGGDRPGKRRPHREAAGSEAAQSRP